jgi:hypothetical protein
MHGAGGGAPRGKRNGNYRHGQRTLEAMAPRAEISALVRESQRTASSIRSVSRRSEAPYPFIA